MVHVLAYLDRGERPYPEAWPVHSCATTFARYVRNAWYRGVLFALTREEFDSIQRAPECWMCGSAQNLLGVDRVDSRLGYTMDNVRPCCGECQYFRRNGDMEPFLQCLGEIAALNSPETWSQLPQQPTRLYHFSVNHARWLEEQEDGEEG